MRRMFVFLGLLTSVLGPAAVTGRAARGVRKRIQKHYWLTIVSTISIGVPTRS